MAVAKQASEDEHDPDDDIPRWVKPMITPMKANVSVVTVEYGLHEGRFWLPRTQTLEGEAQVSFMHIPFKLEQRYTYSSVNGGEPMQEIVVAAMDTATDSVSRASRRERHRTECEQGTQHVRLQHRSEEDLRILVRVPCDTVALARGADTLHRTVGGHDSLVVALPLDVSLRGLLVAGNAVVGYGMVPYRLVGDITAETPIGARKIPFDQKGEFAPVR